MIKDIKENLLKVQQSPYFYKANYVLPKQYNKYHSKNNNSNPERIATNPFEEDKKINEIQLYFNDKYSDIRLFLDEIIKKLQKEGSIAEFINDCTLKYSSIYGRYLLGENTENSGKYFLVIEKDKKILKIKEDKAFISVEFNKFGISKIEKKENAGCEVLYFKKKNVLERFLNPDGLRVLKYEKRYANIVEIAEFSKKLKCEKFVLYKNNILNSEIIFDSSDYTEQISKENKIIPLEYRSYNELTGEIRQKLIFQYALPYKYIEYDLNTNKQTRIFILHGIKNFVYKYSFFNSLTGQIMISGNL